MNVRLQKQFQFLREIDKLKQVLRQTRLLCDSDRRENDAEHSWHLAMYVIILQEYADSPDIDWFKVMKLVIIHDLVEIYAGDTFIHDNYQSAAKIEREQQAAQQLFALLPHDQCQHLHSLWREFEDRTTKEARFAAVVDRLQPFLHNFYSDGGTWHLPGVTASKEAAVMAVIGENSEVLGRFIEEALTEAVETGKLRTETITVT